MIEYKGHKLNIGLDKTSEHIIWRNFSYAKKKSKEAANHSLYVQRFLFQNGLGFMTHIIISTETATLFPDILKVGHLKCPYIRDPSFVDSWK